MLQEHETNDHTLTTLRHIIDMSYTYWAYLTLNQHEENIKNSIRHTSFILSESEPSTNNEKLISPLYYAMWFSFGTIINDIYETTCSIKENAKPKNRTANLDIIILETLYAIKLDDCAIGAYIRYLKTGYVNRHKEQDLEDIKNYKQYIRELIQKDEEIKRAVLQWDLAITINVERPVIIAERLE